MDYLSSASDPNPWYHLLGFTVVQFGCIMSKDKLLDKLEGVLRNWLWCNFLLGINFMPRTRHYFQ